MNEEDLINFKDLRFTVTKDMENSIIKMLVIQQMIKERELTLKDKKLLEKEKESLLKSFIKDFQALNVVQVATIRAYLNGKKN